MSVEIVNIKKMPPKQALRLMKNSWELLDRWDSAPNIKQYIIISLC